MDLLFRLALVLIVMAVSVFTAPSRGQMAGAMQITICAEGGPQTLTLDATGTPLPLQHGCPDCLPGLGAAVLPDFGPPRRIVLAQPLSLPMPNHGVRAGLIRVRTTARGPPVLI